jgi:hypothetical protein
MAEHQPQRAIGDRATTAAASAGASAASSSSPLSPATRATIRASTSRPLTAAISSNSRQRSGSAPRRCSITPRTPAGSGDQERAPGSRLGGSERMNSAANSGLPQVRSCTAAQSERSTGRPVIPSSISPISGAASPSSAIRSKLESPSSWASTGAAGASPRTGVR